MSNRLRDATSPYLRQHADNPVDWWPWSVAAFDEARRRDVPVLLSVGYAACHWCHVMAHESFEDEQVAQVLGADYVAIKVDREERPDIDAVYMSATTALTGSGGWPMTCVLTPDGAPFYAGTYFPKTQFLQVLAAVTSAWRGQRADIDRSAEQITQALRQLQAHEGAPGAPLDAEALDRCEDVIADTHDWSEGGFGTAPKFPPSMVLEWLLRHHARTGTPRALQMVQVTGEAMARGGVFDQLAGGFARYGVDARWVVPHFEKMLYDNAQLLAVYLHLWRATGTGWARRVADQTADFLLADLRTPEDGFASALDADTVVDGRSVEGYTYAWTPQQLRDALGCEEGARAAGLLGVTDDGTFEHGTSTLQLRLEPAAGEEAQWWARTRARLRSVRDNRPQPARDDKVVAAWNGMAIGALAEAGALLDRPELVEAARAAAEFVLRVHLVDGRLRRTSRDGVVGSAAGVADDYGNLATGLLTLHQVDGDPRWLAVAGRLLDVALDHFRADDGGFYDTADDADLLVLRPRGATDNAEPSGQSALAAGLLTYGELMASTKHIDAATQAIACAATIATAAPRFAGWSLATAEALLDGPRQVAIVHAGAEPDAAARELIAVARAATAPGLVVTQGPVGAPGVPALADRPLVAGAAAAYVCRGTLCQAPITGPQELRAALARDTGRGVRPG